MLGLFAGPVAFSLRAVMMPILMMILGGYVLVGLFIGLGFVLRGVNRVDGVAGGSHFVFRIVILPGCVGLWPVVLLMWIRAGKGASA